METEKALSPICRRVRDTTTLPDRANGAGASAIGVDIYNRGTKSGADPENELRGGQFRGSPAGSRGGGPVGGLGDEVPQKQTTFRS